MLKAQQDFAAFSGKIGVGWRDISPPVGIFYRNWGAAAHDASEGLHRPLTVTALAISDQPGGAPLLLVAIDLGWFTTPRTERVFREPLLQALALDESRVMICLSHTHSAPSTAVEDAHRPGGHLIERYAVHVRQALLDAARQAVQSAQPATLTWRYGRCDLATNRDLPAPDGNGLVVGYNPAVAADDTLLVGRVTRDRDGSALATIVNYACHPTTLGWDSRLVSPDYIGAMREVVEGATGGAPCLFLQGASGDLAPIEQYTGDVAIVDRHGRRLGHAVVATLMGMTPPSTQLRFDRAVESGARLGVWSCAPAPIDSTVEAVCISLPLPLKPRPSVEEIDRQMAEINDRALVERLVRKRRIVEFLGVGATKEMPLWAWRIGPALLVGQPLELYSAWQQALRAAWPDAPVAVMNLVNGSLGYVVPPDKCDPGLYAWWQSPFAADAYRIVSEQSLATGQRLLGS